MPETQVPAAALPEQASVPVSTCLLRAPPAFRRPASPRPDAGTHPAAATPGNTNSFALQVPSCLEGADSAAADPDSAHVTTQNQVPPTTVSGSAAVGLPSTDADDSASTARHAVPHSWSPSDVPLPTAIQTVTAPMDYCSSASDVPVNASTDTAVATSTDAPPPAAGTSKTDGNAHSDPDCYIQTKLSPANMGTPLPAPA